MTGETAITISLCIFISQAVTAVMGARPIPLFAIAGLAFAAYGLTQIFRGEP